MGFGIAAELKAFIKLVTAFMEEQKQFNAEQKQFNAEQKQFNADVNNRLTSVALQLTRVEGKVDLLVQGQQEINTKVDFLVSELSRYKNDSGEMLLSMYAFCNIYGVQFSYGNDADEHSLASMGKRATRYSRRNNFTIETTADPRFGKVMLYDPRVLEDLFLGDED